MIILLFFWIYITLICLAWGNIFINVLTKNIAVPDSEIELSIACLTGLSVVGVIVFYLSLFIPLNFKAHCIILIPAVIYYLSAQKRNIIKAQIVSAFNNFSVSVYLLLSACILITLLISSNKIIHPDTLAYHAQSIQWFQNYKAVPGTVNLKLELGMQSLWFALQAIFNPDYNTLNFFPLSGCVVCWYLIFIIKKIDGSFFSKKLFNNNIEKISWGWLLLSIYSLFSWTQVRLTAASASPDFIVTLLMFTVFYTFYKDRKNNENKFFFFLVTFFCCIAFITKLSSIALLLFPFIIVVNFLYRRNFKPAILISLLSIIIITPFLIRNFISSGYLLYPSSFPDFFNPDWKLKADNIHKFQHYISAYARYPIDFNDTENNFNLPFTKWIPAWWKHLTAIDSIVLCVIFVLSMLNIIFLKSLIKKLAEKNFAVIFFIALSGSILWFIKAPDPRFGTGFLITLIYVLYLPLRSKIDFLSAKINPLIYKLLIWILIFAVLVYSVYRLNKFFKPIEIIYPAGVEKVNYKNINLNNVNFNLVTDTTGCGLTPVPCITDSTKIIPRGELITDGFKIRDN